MSTQAVSLSNLTPRWVDTAQAQNSMNVPFYGKRHCATVENWQADYFMGTRFRDFTTTRKSRGRQTLRTRQYCQRRVCVSCDCSRSVSQSTGCRGLTLLVEPGASMFEVVVVCVWILDKTFFHSERTVVFLTQWKQKMNRP